MAELREALISVVEMEKRESALYNPDDMSEAQDLTVAAANANPVAAWDVFRNGSNGEFAALVNLIGELGGKFETDDVLTEIMRLAKVRENAAVMEATQAGFGAMFDKYYKLAFRNEQPSCFSPIRKARTFKQVISNA